MTKKPFSEKTLSFYTTEKHNSSQMLSKSKTEERRQNIIASPNLQSKFSPSLNILNSPIMKNQRKLLKNDNLSKYCLEGNTKNQSPYNPNRPDDKLYQTKSVEFPRNNGLDKENLYMNIIENNTDKNASLLHPVRQEKIGTNSIENPEVTKEEIDDEVSPESLGEEVSYDGYLMKLVDDKLKKLWFTLYEKYLYYYKHKNDTVHKGMHCLTDAYIKPCGKVTLMNVNFFRFEIFFQNKVREYYVQNEEEYKVWIDKINLATGNSSINNKYEIIEKLNSGKFGVIKQVVNKETKEICVLKIMNKKTMNSKDLQELKTEVEIMKICQHPNIVKLYDIFENQDSKYLVMELCEEGDLFKYLESRNFKLNEKEVIGITRQILAACFYLQQYGITHRDLKPENILVKKENGQMVFKIADFGLSKIILPEETCEEPYGTLCYCAPEIVAHKPYNKQVDLWSIGIIVYLMLIGCLPFNVNSKESDIIHQILNEPTPYPTNQWKKVSFVAKSFVIGLLQKEPSKRLTIKQALEHEWLAVSKENKIGHTKSKSMFAEYCNV